MKQYEKKALKLPWAVAAEIASVEIEKIIGRRINCTGSMDDLDYWCFGFREDRMLMSEVYKILETIGATEKQRIECLPAESDHMTSVNGLFLTFFSALLYGLQNLCIGQSVFTLSGFSLFLCTLGTNLAAPNLIIFTPINRHRNGYARQLTAYNATLKFFCIRGIIHSLASVVGAPVVSSVGWASVLSVVSVDSVACGSVTAGSVTAGSVIVGSVVEVGGSVVTVGSLVPVGSVEGVVLSVAEGVVA